VFERAVAPRVALTVLVAGVLAGLGAAAAQAPVAVPAPGERLGINAQVLMQQRPSARRRDRHLDAMRVGGIRLVRLDATWARAEPAPPRAPGRRRFDWRYDDRWVAALAIRGMRWLPILDYSAHWATSIWGKEHAPPATDALFAGYAKAFAARYGAGGTFWRRNPWLPALPVTTYEVWNEPNLRTFWGRRKPDPRRYAGLFLAARIELKRTDPAGRVIVGGLAGRAGAPEYLRAMYRARPALRGRVDGVGLHLYAPTPEEMYARTAEMRRALDAVDRDGLPLDVTEIGWVARTPAEERRRTTDLARVARELPTSDCGIGLFLPHTWESAERDREKAGDWFGLVGADATPKPSGAAYLQVVAAPPAAEPARRALCAPAAPSSAEHGR